MDVQTNIGHIVKMFAGYKPYNLADFKFRIIFCYICKSIMIDLFVFRQLRYIVQCSTFGISKVGTCIEWVRAFLSLPDVMVRASNLALFIDAWIVTKCFISMQKRQTLIFATCARMRVIVSCGNVSILSSSSTFKATAKIQETFVRTPLSSV